MGVRLALVALLVLASGARAQTTVPASWLVYRQVRLQAPRLAPQEISGTVLRADGVGLSLMPDGARVATMVPLATLERVRVLERPGHSIAWGALGAVAGAATGYELFARSTGGDEGGLAGLVFGIPSGALVGAFIGAQAGRARWREVRIVGAGGS